jgi:hypothetical protein
MLRLAALVVLVLAAAPACKGAETPVAAKTVDLDGDPLALLPGSAVVVGQLDARAMFASGDAGVQMAALADRLVPVGDAAGFVAKRDVDRVVLGVYAGTGADVAAVLSGRFDEAKIAAATTSRTGATVTRGVYAEHTTYMAGPVMYSVLTPRTVVAGTGDGVRRVLERVQGASLERAIPPWMLETLSTPGAQLALAADFTSHPVAQAALGSASLPWLTGIRTAKVVGNFQKPGMNVGATVTYGDPKQAATAADGVRLVDGWLNILGPLFGGVALQNLDVKVDANDVKCKFAIDAQTLANVLALAPRLLPNSQ